MILLLDTHVVLWSLSAPTRLRSETRKRIEAPDTVVFVSAVTAWEIELKRALGKLRAPHDLADQLRARRFQELPLRIRHIQALSALPALHRDPFDRALVAQAVADNLVLVTSDAQLRAYPVKTLAA